MELPDELRPVGPGRYGFVLRLPWGQEVPAELLVACRRGWGRRPEASDPQWSAFEVGPAMVAIRLVGPAPRTPGDLAPGPPRRVRRRTLARGCLLAR